MSDQRQGQQAGTGAIRAYLSEPGVLVKTYDVDGHYARHSRECACDLCIGRSVEQASHILAETEPNDVIPGHAGPGGMVRAWNPRIASKILAESLAAFVAEGRQ